MTSRCFKHILAVFTLLFSMSGCGLASFTRLCLNDPITPEHVAFISPGQTTFAQVVAKLGAPDELVALDDQGVVAFYHFLDAKYARINYGWPLQFISPVSVDMIMAGGGLGADMFEVIFDTHWVAKQHTFAKHVQASHYTLWPFK